MSQGFKSLSQKRRREIASLGGKKAAKLGVSHKFSKVEAARAAAKAGEMKKITFALKAAKRLLEIGFLPVDLANLNLSHDEYIYYGGNKRNKLRYKRLAERIIKFKENENVKNSND